MTNRFKKYIAALLLLIISQTIHVPVENVQALAPIAPRFASAYELIDAVNTYRVQHGLTPYVINSILMGTAQSQAEYMASTGTVTHSGPGGISFPDRLIAAGYSFVFRSENIMSTSSDATGWSIVTSAGWADELHQHTMLSPDLKEIGAGVSVSGGRGYYVIDCGGSGGGSGGTISTPQNTVVPGSTPIIAGNALGTPVIVVPNTPRSDGSITHLVQPGETLWSIAIAYKTTINELKANNRLSDDNIYPGNTLTIVLPKPTGTATETATGTPYPSATAFVFWTVTSSPVPTVSAVPSTPVQSGSSAVVVGAIITSALLLGGVLTLTSSRKNRKK